MYTLRVDQTVLLQVTYADAGGNPATVEGDVEWRSSDEELATVGIDPGDSVTCRVTPVGPVGQVQIIAMCSARIGDDVREMITTCDIELVGGEAVLGSVQPLGEAEQKF